MGFKIEKKVTKSRKASPERKSASKTKIKDMVHLVVRDNPMIVFKYIKYPHERKGNIRKLFDITCGKLVELFGERFDRNYVDDVLRKALKAKLPEEKIEEFYDMDSEPQPNSILDHINYLPPTLSDIIHRGEISRVKMNSGRIEVDFAAITNGTKQLFNCSVVDVPNGKHYLVKEQGRNGAVFIDTIQ